VVAGPDDDEIFNSITISDNDSREECKGQPSRPAEARRSPKSVDLSFEVGVHPPSDDFFEVEACDDSEDEQQPPKAEDKNMDLIGDFATPCFYFIEGDQYDNEAGSMGAFSQQ
jgi:hypothetical protein